ncbi:MAG TPA: cytoplasmic protein [Syntrophales bacterium]|nr:cytoplasmic protein [Syntrophales bacterium]HOL58625.1 cytoplasmic protein [Syntrophales bacterium]HPO35087.1 cytoplasmic protein [Syntrophales bacterium]
MKREQYRDFDATELFCPRCRRAVPVRKRLLLVLPEGDKYDYSCVFCGTSVGDKIVRGANDTELIIVR